MMASKTQDEGRADSFLSFSDFYHFDGDFERYSVGPIGPINKIVHSVCPKSNVFIKNEVSSNHGKAGAVPSGNNVKSDPLKKKSPVVEFKSLRNPEMHPGSSVKRKKTSPKFSSGKNKVKVESSASHNRSYPAKREVNMVVTRENEHDMIDNGTGNDKMSKAQDQHRLEKIRNISTSAVDSQTGRHSESDSISGKDDQTISLHSADENQNNEPALPKIQGQVSVEIERIEPEQDRGQLDKLAQKHFPNRKDIMGPFKSGQVEISKRSQSAPKKYAAFLSGILPLDDDGKSRKSRVSFRRAHGAKQRLFREGSCQESTPEKDMSKMGGLSSKSLRSKSLDPKTNNFQKCKSLLFASYRQREKPENEDSERKMFSIKAPEGPRSNSTKIVEKTKKKST